MTRSHEIETLEDSLSFSIHHRPKGRRKAGQTHRAAVSQADQRERRVKTLAHCHVGRAQPPTTIGRHLGPRHGPRGTKGATR